MGFLDRFRKGADRAETPAPTDSTGEPPTHEEQLEWLEDSARELVASAFLTLDEAEETLHDQFVEEDPALTKDEVRTTLHRVWQERLDQQATWADEGDYARVRAAFDRLEAAGIVARMNFTCCQTCGHAEIDDERAEESRGYTFFHQQDAERLEPGSSELYLAFGGFRYAADVDGDLVARALDGDEDAKKRAIVLSEESVGREIADALREQGLTVTWNGTCADRIRVADVDWRKRLPVG